MANLAYLPNIRGVQAWAQHELNTDLTDRWAAAVLNLQGFERATWAERLAELLRRRQEMIQNLGRMVEDGRAAQG